MYTRKSGISRNTTLIIGLTVIVIIVIAGILLTHPFTTHQPPTSSTSTISTSSTTQTTTTTTVSTTSITTTSTATKSLLAPANSSVLVDDSQTAAPDSLDPDTGFSPVDSPYFTAVYQELVEYNGSNTSQVVPVIAQNWSIINNYKTYVFTIRNGVTFSNNDGVTAATVWFSFVRAAYMGQPPGLSDYQELTINLSEYSATGYAFPWGIRHAIQAATGLPVLSNSTLAVEALNNVLSNFNPSNSTIQKIMEYPNQAYVVTGPMTFETNLLEPYRYWLLDIALWWGAIVDPAFVDSHGGVQGNTANSYYSVNGGPGTGPYETYYVGNALSTIVLKSNPNYWAAKMTGLPAIIQPAHIDTVVINYGLTHNDRVAAFASNQAQISYVSIPFFNQMYSAFAAAHPGYTFNDIFDNLGPQPNFYYITMNTQKFPTNITDFRLAIAHAINYTEMLNELFNFNGTLLAERYLGPVSPVYSEFYNPGRLPLYSYNLSLAAYYLNLSGYQGDFYVVMPNGTILGNPHGNPLPTQTITYLAPITPFTQEQLEIIQQGLSQLGISIGYQGVTFSTFLTWSTPQATPNFVNIGWTPDWSDPIMQEIAPLTTTTSLVMDWMNVSLVNKIMATLPFETNLTQQIQGVEEIYNITYNYAPMVWLVNINAYYFVQPYLKGFVYNFGNSYYYNLMYYSS